MANSEKRLKLCILESCSWSRSIVVSCVSSGPDLIMTLGRFGFDRRCLKFAQAWSREGRGYSLLIEFVISFASL